MSESLVLRLHRSAWAESGQRESSRRLASLPNQLLIKLPVLARSRRRRGDAEVPSYVEQFHKSTALPDSDPQVRSKV